MEIMKNIFLKIYVFIWERKGGVRAGGENLQADSPLSVECDMGAWLYNPRDNDLNQNQESAS